MMACEQRMGSLETLNEISRTRSLTSSETRRLQLALWRQEPKGQKHWTHADEMRLATYLIRGKRPAVIGALMGRTERAIWRKMYKMGWGVSQIMPEEGSNGRLREKGSMARNSEVGER